jgi:hypothetical protein
LARRSRGFSVFSAPVARISERKADQLGFSWLSWVWKVEREYSEEQVRQTRERR